MGVARSSISHPAGSLRALSTFTGIWGLGFIGFRAEGSGLGVEGLGLRV